MRPTLITARPQPIFESLLPITIPSKAKKFAPQLADLSWNSFRNDTCRAKLQMLTAFSPKHSKYSSSILHFVSSHILAKIRSRVALELVSRVDESPRVDDVTEVLFNACCALNEGVEEPGGTRTKINSHHYLVRNLLQSVESADVVKSVDARRQTAVQAENLKKLRSINEQ